MDKRIAWSQIRDFFGGHWIELVDVEWSQDSNFPTRARVRNFAPERSTLIDLIAESGEQEDAVILYLGNMSPLVEFDSKAATL